MQLSESVKLYPTVEQEMLLRNAMGKYICAVNQTVKNCSVGHIYIVAEAVVHNVSVIQLERLQNIRNATRTSRKNNHSLHTWSFYRLAQYIEYKAKLSGIEVKYVNPAYTSQRCPICGHKHHAKDRHYVCECGFIKHRDVVGAMNICTSTEVCGNSKSA